MPRSRRSLLEATAAALGGALATTAGCLRTARQPGTAADGTTGDGATADGTRADGTTSAASTPAAPDRAAIDFREWLPDPTTTPLPDGYGFQYFDVAGIRDRRSALHPNAYDRLERQMLRPVPREHDGIEAVHATIQLDHIAELTFGSFDPETFAAALRSDDRSPTPTTETPTTATRTPWPAPERYRGFDLHGTDYVYAVSPDALFVVAPMFDGDAVAFAKAIIDASSPETGQYADGNEYVASLLGLVESPHALWCYPEATDGSTSRGFRADAITGGLTAWRFGPETTRLTFGNTYVDASTAASGELREYIDRESERFGPYDGLDVSVEGRLAWTEGTIPTAAFDHLSPGGPADSVTTPN